jgi:hypothetical protein
MLSSQLSSWSLIDPVDLTILPAIGLDSEVLTAFLVLLSLAIFIWGFERYRRSFSKTEFFVALALSVGIFVVGVFPDLFALFGSVLHVERRSLVVSLIANAVLVFLILHLFARTRSNQASVADLTRSLAADQAVVSDDDNPTIAVTIPAYNEGESIQSVIDVLPDAIQGYSIKPIVVSDGSTDKTATLAERSGAMVVEHPLNQGQGGALKTGFEIARQNNANIIVTMDADGQHPVKYLSNIVEPIIADEADYVVGSRYAGVDNSGNGVARKTGIRVFTTLINVLMKTEITDCTNGFRAMRGSKVDNMTLTEERFSAPELIIEAGKNDLRIQELPITIAAREAGETKKPKLGYAIGLTRTIFTTWIR